MKSMVSTNDLNQVIKVASRVQISKKSFSQNSENLATVLSKMTLFICFYFKFFENLVILGLFKIANIKLHHVILKILEWSLKIYFISDFLGYFLGNKKTVLLHNCEEKCQKNDGF